MFFENFENVIMTLIKSWNIFVTENFFGLHNIIISDSL